MVDSGWGGVGDLFGITEDPACCGGGEGMGIGFVVKGDGRRTPILELAALGGSCVWCTRSRGPGLLSQLMLWVSEVVL